MRLFVKPGGKAALLTCLLAAVFMVSGMAWGATPSAKVTGIVKHGTPMNPHVLPVSSRARAKKVSPVVEAQVQSLMASMPLRFEPNEGQFDSQVRFAARGRTSVVCTDQGLILRVGDKTISLTAEGGKAQRVYGRQLLRAKANYFIGNDPKKWHKGVPTYGEVVFHNLYPGIDMVVSGDEGRLTTDFVVYPGADPSAIKLKVKGATPSIDSQGRLVLKTGNDELAFSAPYSYQAVNGELKKVDSRFVVKGNAYGFALSKYRKDAPVVIDPSLEVSCDVLLGSDDNVAEGYGVAIDCNGNIYMTGYTNNGFPVQTAQKSYCATYGGGASDAFVVKAKLDYQLTATTLKITGVTLLYSTYLGGSGKDVGKAIAVDCNGMAYVAGQTCSTNFPVTPNAYCATYQGGDSDAFVTVLSPDGSGLVYSTYLGGSDSDAGYGVAVDCFGMAYVAGQTCSTNFPVTPNAYCATYQGGDSDAFVSKINPSVCGTASLVYSTYLGGSDSDAGYGVAVDCLGMAYVAGQTCSTNFPVTPNAYCATQPGPTDAFVSKINPSVCGTASLVYSTYLGGSGNDVGYGIAVDCLGRAYVTGQTCSTNFPTFHAYRATYQGGNDAFISKINPSGCGTESLLYSTYLGGDGEDVGRGIAVNCFGYAFVAGYTASANFPATADAFGKNFNGGAHDAFVSVFEPTGSSLSYSTYLGMVGGTDDKAFGIALQDRCCCCCCCTDVGSTGYVCITGSTEVPSGSSGGTAIHARKRRTGLERGGSTLHKQVLLPVGVPASTEPTIFPPEPPTGVEASSEGCEEGCVSDVTVKWKTARGAAGYLIYNADANQIWKWVKDATTTSYTFHNLPCGRTYHFYVRTHSNYGNSRPSKTVAVVVPSCSSGGGTETPAVSLVWPQNNAVLGYNDFESSPGVVVFAWNRLADANGYLLWLKLDDGEHEPVEASVVLSAAKGLIEVENLAGIYFVLDKAGWNSLVPYTVTWQVSALSDPEDLNSVMGSSEKYSFTFEEASGESN